MSIWFASLLIGLGGILLGVGLSVLALWQIRARAPKEPAEPKVPLPALSMLAPVEPSVPTNEARTALALRLASEALRGPLRQLRRTGGVPAEPVEELAHLARQLRMLVSGPRLMRAAPTSPITLLEQAAEQVPALRLGKIPVSWSLLCRQPVYVDPERAETGFSELLHGAATAAGEGGRLGIKVVPGESSRYPVRVEIEIGSKGADGEPLPLLVGRHLLEGQGALVEEDGRTLWVSLMSTQPDPTGPGAGTAARAERTPEEPAAEEPAAEEPAAEEPGTEQSEAEVLAPEESARVPVSD